jgi:hypothetical protein
MDNKTLEMAFIKFKIDEVEKLRNLYFEEKKETHGKITPNEVGVFIFQKTPSIFSQTYTVKHKPDSGK